jgi:hypothetical protein
MHAARRYAGLDKTVALVLANKTWATIAGALSVLIVARSLTRAEQGLYYTFNSLIALQVFVELGLGAALTVFASHERAYLRWTPLGTLEGSHASRARLGSLLRFSLRWYAAAGAALIAVILPLGLWFFGHPGQSTSPVGWRLPWICLPPIAAGTLVASAQLFIFEGCGCVAEIATVRITASVLSCAALWLALPRIGLIAAPLSAATTLSVYLTHLAVRRSTFYADLLSLKTRGHQVSWAREIWPFQWRLGATCITGYLIFQVLTPLTFKLEGPIAAGQMGLSLTVLGGALAAGLGWMNARAPQFGAHAAKLEHRELDSLFLATFTRCVALLVLNTAAATGGVAWLHHSGNSYQNRVLPTLPFVLLAAKTVTDGALYCLATYLRAFKLEPFYALYIAAAVITPAASYLAGSAFGVTGIAAGSLCVTALVSLPSGIAIFAKTRAELRSRTASDLQLAQNTV